ncbi:MAG: DUF1883 domain-containing protein [Staphylococcus equorum]|uniref:DUF1883 domain-containing protein n=1 Tax=Staphylococcus equorum TaxID=246432 RepID=A0AAW7AGJ7_9STAP|nr:DUF1883 domain-containing protein [Staphylococcus equorum]MDK9865293.1 DUF1883 domain-containing protein [Staphylococcus equorum]MDK9870066.1 DUF1883 domain-containing protein [Staphylococcus equorum]MDK9870635.1 DUF1883 domain-containing protein [Staphylococcus equorum]MDK9876033.1 DUF1883 domain-containing protein [Staphylococcus equorum]MDN6570497.1 DUF1883 domain-containing protein [Staphylococcus equorum]
MVAKIPTFESNGSLTVEVKLDNASNVILVNKINYRKYLKGQRFSYYGGYFDRNPAVITINESGIFYLIVDSSSYSFRYF